MQVYCPQCHVGYQFDDSLLMHKSQKLKCSSCGAVFTVSEAVAVAEEIEKQEENAFENLVLAMNDEGEGASPDSAAVDEVLPQDEASDDSKYDEALLSESFSEPSTEDSVPVFKQPAAFVTDDVVPAQDESAAEEALVNEEVQDEDEESDVQVDLEKIFERLSEHTESLIEREKKLSFYEKAWLQIKNILGFHFKISWVYLLGFCAIYGSVALYNNRYDVVRKAPFMNAVYKAFGIKAKIPGEGLEFQNVNWEYLSDDEGTRLEIKGFINNMTEHDVALPTVHIEILDKETVLLQSQNREIDETKVEAETKIPLEFVIQNPAPTAKYVYMTFIDKD